MTYMTLSDTYRVGLPSVDGEHEELMDLINQIYEGLHAHASQNEVNQMFQRFTDCTSTHFWREEMQFAETRYPDAVTHTRKHEHLMKTLACFGHGVDRMGRTVSVEDQLDFLRDWLLDHIDTEDRQFGDYLSAQKRAT
jgi:hemerythrin